MVVTEDVTTTHNWVLKPSELSAIEVLGSGLDPVNNRIMVTSCNSACGVGSATSSATVNGFEGSQEVFNNWLPTYHPSDDPLTAGQTGYVASASRYGLQTLRIANTACAKDYQIY